MELTRRNACLSLALLSRISAWAAELPSLKSKAYRFEDLPVEKEERVAYRGILEGRTHTGDYLEAHETVLQPDATPHPSHHHVGEELFLISSGMLEVTIAGKASKLGPGSAFFIASNEEHSIRNVGTTPAQYFGITLGEKA
jgi:mannose-6-phosphate isomerase-like protein (cupin superfamily)